jgi:hypothetical protein
MPLMTAFDDTTEVFMLRWNEMARRRSRLAGFGEQLELRFSLREVVFWALLGSWRRCGSPECCRLHETGDAVCLFWWKSRCVKDRDLPSAPDFGVTDAVPTLRLSSTEPSVGAVARADICAKAQPSAAHKVLTAARLR